jgi:hypothetical protein
MTIAATLLGWITGPLFGQVLEGYRAKLAADGAADRLAADLGLRDLELASREAELRSAERLALIGRWHEPANLLGYILVVYVAKVVLWDSVLGLGETPAVRGAVGEWLGLVATFFVGGRAAVGVGLAVARLGRR